MKVWGQKDIACLGEVLLVWRSGGCPLGHPWPHNRKSL